MLDSHIRKQLLIHAEQLALQLAEYVTPQTLEPFAAQNLNDLITYLQATRSIHGLIDLIPLFNNCYAAQRSLSARAQIEVIVQHIDHLVKNGVTDVGYLIYILVWTRRLITKPEEPVEPRDDKKRDRRKISGKRSKKERKIN